MEKEFKISDNVLVFYYTNINTIDVTGKIIAITEDFVKIREDRWPYSKKWVNKDSIQIITQ